VGAAGSGGGGGVDAEGGLDASGGGGGVDAEGESEGGLAPNSSASFFQSVDFSPSLIRRKPFFESTQGRFGTVAKRLIV